MKKELAFIFIIYIFFSYNSYSQIKITANEAGNHIGEFAIVAGTVSQVYHSRGGTCFLDIDGEYPNNIFVGVIFKSDVKQFTDIENYEGKKIEVKGAIKEYNGKPEIILRNQSQIKIISENGQ